MMSLRKELSTEGLPRPETGQSGANQSSRDGESLVLHGEEIKNLSDEDLADKLELVLLDKIKSGDNAALFQLGQLYYEQDDYDNAVKYFDRAAAKGDYQAMFQLGVLHYDGLGSQSDQKKGVEYMHKVAESSSKRAKHLKFAAQYNLGLAYFQGCGVKRSSSKAEKFWVLAADDGNPKASVKAQTTLALLYATDDMKNLKKSFFWHSEACGNGSLESQGAMGVMYLNGFGCKKNIDSAFICLREAAERGNVCAMGHLVAYYYRRKFYTKTIELAARVSQFQDPNEIASDTDCLPSFVAQGIAMACFYYARCLHKGLGVKKNEDLAKPFYSKCYQMDPAVCAQLQSMTQKGEI